MNLDLDQDYEQEIGKDRTTRIGGINSIDVNGEILETFNNKVTKVMMVQWTKDMVIRLTGSCLV